MDVGSIENLINGVGFPIFCVLALGFFIYKSYEKITERNQDREERLYKMIEDNHQEMERLEKTNSEFVEVLHVFRTDLEDIKEAVTSKRSPTKGVKKDED